MENTSFGELQKQRKFHLEKIAELNQQIADYQTQRLAEKRQISKAELQYINEEYIKVFSGDPYLNRLLFTKIDDFSFSFPLGLSTKLKEQHLFYVWQIVIRTEDYFQQNGILGFMLTGKLKRHLAERGLYFGMKLRHIIKTPEA